MAAILQISMVGVWGALVLIHMRRLFRLACVDQLRRWEGMRFRSGLNRIWWWLGQDEFWHAVRIDCARCLLLTALIFVEAWGLALLSV